MRIWIIGMLLVVSTLAYANEGEVDYDALFSEMKVLNDRYEELARCTHVSSGNEDGSQNAQRRLYPEMIANAREILVLINNMMESELDFIMEVMGEDVLVGYMMGQAEEEIADFIAETKALVGTYGGDRQKAHKEMWNNQGCNSIYDGLLAEEQ